MKSEIQNAIPESPHVHSALTPSELAALLGPRADRPSEPVSIVAETSTSRWTSFAQEFTRRLTARLRPLIRAAVRVTFSGSSTHTAENLTTSQETLEVVSLWQSESSLEPLAIVLSAPLVASFVDRLLGGRSAPYCDESERHRPLTEVDQRLASRLKDAVHCSMSETVGTPSLLKLIELPGCTSSLDEAWLPDCPLVRLSFELRFVQGGGWFDLLLPSEISESLVDQVESADSEIAASIGWKPDCPRVPPQRSEVVAQLSQISLLKSDLQSLAVGDVLLMPSPWDQSVRVFVDGLPRFAGTAGISEGRKAIRLTNAETARAP